MVLTDSCHPRRPRGSQSGREKRRDESFLLRALLTVTENFRPAFYPDPTDFLWVSEGGFMSKVKKKNRAGKGLFSRGAPELDPNLRFNSFIKAVIPVS